MTVSAASKSPPIGLGPGLDGADAAQRRVVDRITAGPRGSVPSPFLAMLDAPRLADAIQEVGVVLRFHSSLPDTLREVAILATAGAVNCGYEWNYHVPLARRAGVPAAAIAATRTGARATELEKPTTTVIAFCRAIATHGQAPPALFAAMIAQVGRTATTELIAIAGYYALLANFIKAAGADEAVADRGC